MWLPIKGLFLGVRWTRCGMIHHSFIDLWLLPSLILFRCRIWITLLELVILKVVKAILWLYGVLNKCFCTTRKLIEEFRQLVVIGSDFLPVWLFIMTWVRCLLERTILTCICLSLNGIVWVRLILVLVFNPALIHIWIFHLVLLICIRLQRFVLSVLWHASLEAVSGAETGTWSLGLSQEYCLLDTTTMDFDGVWLLVLKQSCTLTRLNEVSMLLRGTYMLALAETHHHGFLHLIGIVN